LSVSRAKSLSRAQNDYLLWLHRWRDEAVRAGSKFTQIVVAFEAGGDGFRLARWLEARGVEAQVIHPSSVAVSREHGRAKTDRLDTVLLKRGFLGWLRGERGHCRMVRVPTIGVDPVWWRVCRLGRLDFLEHLRLIGDWGESRTLR
jgi:transposase